MIYAPYGVAPFNTTVYAQWRPAYLVVTITSANGVPSGSAAGTSNPVRGGIFISRPPRGYVQRE